MSEPPNAGGPRATSAARRRLLRYLLESPLLAAGAAALPRLALARPELALPEDVADALDVFQIERGRF